MWCVSRLLRHLIPRTPTSVCSWHQSHPLIPAHGVVAPDATLVSCEACIRVSQETGRTAQAIITGRMCLDPFIRSLNLLTFILHLLCYLLSLSLPLLAFCIAFPPQHIISLDTSPSFHSIPSFTNLNDYAHCFYTTHTRYLTHSYHHHHAH